MSKQIVSIGLGQGQITLEGTAVRVNALCKEAVDLSKASILRAKSAGELLVSAKENIRHGAFEAWVENKIDIGLTHARTCMKIYEHWDELCELHGPGNLAMLSISKAASSIPTRKKTSDPKEEDSPLPKAHNTADFPSTGECEGVACPKGGSHDWEEDFDGTFCRNCHIQLPGSPETDGEDAGEGPVSEAEEPEDEAGQSLDVEQLLSLERRIEKLYGDLTNALAEYEKLKPSLSSADAKQSLDLSFTDWRAHKRIQDPRMERAQ